MTPVIFYTKENCSLCEDAYALLKLLQHDYHFTIEERDIYTNDEWLEEYQLLIPYIKINETELNCEQINYNSLDNALKRLHNV
ncbi:glutaredoxin family protein [Virgibacillus dakarensis]|uniref:glutaredoxin family protein n=1 Tax=Virgibacillus dakarensis TaxID=1917889 RepID=UPI000B431ECB|nr:glutaredoxin family protein [Virgibacillus dakarensis]MBT2217898.1 glutaredoxin family protein [Virgibacillus dakarensis]MTW87578.1 glutaredoxin family protein [Virgibacillus dakarensis]